MEKQIDREVLTISAEWRELNHLIRLKISLPSNQSTTNREQRMILSLSKYHILPRWIICSLFPTFKAASTRTLSSTIVTCSYWWTKLHQLNNDEDMFLFTQFKPGILCARMLINKLELSKIELSKMRLQIAKKCFVHSHADNQAKYL